MNRFLFTVPAGAGATNIFSTDGTTAGVVDLDVSRFGYSSDELPVDFINFDGRAIFMGVGTEGGGAGYTDGTEAGTSFQSLTTALGTFIPESDAVVNGHVLMSGSTDLDSTQGPKEIFSSSDGVNFTPIEIGVGLPLTSPSDDVNPPSVVTSGHIGYFAASVYMSTGPQDGALWRTDGTANGTFQVDPGSSLSPSDIISLGDGRAVYASTDGGDAYALYVTDGSLGSSTQIDNPDLGSNILANIQGASTGTRAVFAAMDSSNSISTWSTDGTAAGTIELTTDGPPSDLSRPSHDYVQLGDKVAFDDGFDLVITDGTSAGTQIIENGETADETVAGNRLFFQETSSPTSIGVSDGTIAGTKSIAVAGLASADGDMIAVGNEVIFTGIDTAGNGAVFQSDGTTAGTHELTFPAGVVAPQAGQIASLPVAAAKPTPPKPTPPAPIIVLGPGDQVYTASSGQAVVAGSGNDTVIATAGDVTVTGGAGRLTFFGGTGPSSVFGGSGSSIIFGGAGGGHFIGGTAGNNILVSQGAAGGNTTLTGGGAGDQIFGSGKGTDVLIAGAGRESILGGGGPTTIQGGSAADVIFTGSGATAVYGGTGPADTIVGGSGALAVTANAGDAIFGNAGQLAVTGSISGADSIIGGSGGLAVTGHGGNMLVVAGSGASTIATGNGASLIFEGTGSSTVTGGTGSMEVVVGSGKASVTGGKGPASFEVVRGSAGGADMLSGFKVGTDTINLFGYSAADVHASIGSGNTLISLADGTRITVIGVTDLGHSLIG